MMLRCVDCGAEFEFTQREQLFYQENGWNAPRRCKSCRVKRNPVDKLPHNHDNHVDATENKSPKNHAPETSEAVPIAHTKFRVNCSSCGVETSVPFKPDPKRPAFCKTCLAKSKAGKK